MISAVFNTLFYNPLYNTLVFLMSHVFPWADIGLVIVFFTLLVKVVLLPVSVQATRTQIQMKSAEKDIEKIRNKHKNDKQAQALETMNLYKELGIKPFSSFFLILVQLPIIFALYYIFLRAGLPHINTDILYSFITPPSEVNTTFLGLFDTTGKSIILSLLTGATQYIQMSLILPKKKQEVSKKPSMAGDLAKNLSTQMRYVFPIIVIVISYSLSAAIALYWTTSNVFHIFQEVVVKRRIMKKQEEKNKNTLEEKQIA